MAISGVANSDVETIAKNFGFARHGTGTADNVAGALNNFSYRPRSATSSDQTGKVLRLTIANLFGLVIVDWGDGTFTQQGAAVSATIDHTYASTGTKTYDITAYAFHKVGTQVLA